MTLEDITYKPIEMNEEVQGVNVIYLDKESGLITLAGVNVIPLLQDETRTIQAYFKNYAYRYKKGGCPDCELHRMKFLEVEYNKYLDKLREKYKYIRGV